MTTAEILSLIAVFLSVGSIYLSVRAAIATYHLGSLPETPPVKVTVKQLEAPTVDHYWSAR
jgi:hypothetical protein